MNMKRVTCAFALFLALGMIFGNRSAAAQLVSAKNTSAIPNALQAAAQTKIPGAALGEWQGTIARLRLVLKLDRAADGAVSGNLVSLDQGNVTIPIETVSFQNGALRLEMKLISAVYEGKLSEDGAEIGGTWLQGGNSVPLVFRRPGAVVVSRLKPTTIGHVQFEPCRTDDGNTEGLCGKFEVYENRQTRSGRKIALYIMVLPALTDKPAPDPFFPLGGGPGQSAVEAFPAAGYVTALRQQRNVFLVDQRGTGHSNLLQCQLKDPGSAQSMVGDFFNLEKLRACRAELEKRADLTQYTTSIAADDLDELRAALGYDKINVFGGSYGTRAGLVYLRRHPDHVRTLTLEGVAPPQYKIPLPFARTIQKSVEHLIDACALDDACKKSFPDLSSEFKTIVDRLEKSPAQFEIRNPAVGKMQTITLSRGMFVANLRGVLYIPALAAQFPSMIHHAFKNDWSAYAAAVLNLNTAFEKVLARGMSFSVLCAEDVPNITETEIKDETANTALGDFQVRLYQKACQEWPRGNIPKDFFAPIHSDVPVLLISGVLDPATPPEMAEHAAHDLAHSRLIAIQEGTHGTGSPCIDGLITKFVVQGSVEGLDPTCTNEIHLPPFGPR
ncbi:MAG TPA: alpha/beta hydrolase [Candidatus Angelobacter sp.]|nr:alpha/beta hydrolase [Candidatus Angelobacter sp.]